MLNKKIVFLCSGNGGNLRFIYYAIQNNLIKNATISAVISDRACNAISFAKFMKINNIELDFKEKNQCSLLRFLDKIDPDIIITNVHKIIFPPVTKKYTGKMINLHYSILPAFAQEIGEKPIEQAIQYGAKFLGVTSHYVTDQVDFGAPICQAIIPIKKNEKKSKR
jgi:phosphoribosylglycinamide formyltransferase-1